MQKVYCYILVCLLFKTAAAQRSLSFFLEAARHNPIVRLDSLQVLANRLSFEQQHAALTGPVLYVDGGYLAAPVLSTGQGKTRFLLNPNKNTTDYTGYDLSLTNGGLYRGEIAFEQPMFTRARTRALEEQNQLEDAQATLHSRFTLHELDKTITDQYLLCQYTRQQQDADRQLLDFLLAQVSISEKLARNALLYRADVQLLQIESERLRTTIAALEAAYTARLLDLYTLCGIRDTARVTLNSISLELDADKPGSSAFTEPYRLDSLFRTAGQHLFNLRYKPQLSLYSSTGLDAAYAPDLLQRFGWQAGLKFTQVLFDGHQRQVNDRRIRLLDQGATWQTDYFLGQNETRKAKLRQQVRALDTQQAATASQQHAYDTLLELYRQQVVAGNLSVINYLTVLRSRAALQQDFATIIYNRELLINEYNYWNW